MPKRLADVVSNEDLPFDPDLLPPADRITSRFGESLRWKKHHGDGWVHYHQESAIGPEVALAVLGAAGLANARMAQAQTEAIHTHETYDAGSHVFQAAHQFRAKNSRWPSLEELLAESTATGGPWIQPQATLDPWGNAILLKALEGDRLMVWSAGPNGRDEDGGGDDIVVAQ